MINPWETKEGKRVWKTKSQYFVWLRGHLRSIWSNYPVRTEWKKDNLRPVTKEERKVKRFHTSTKHVGQCVFCKEWFPGSKLEVDHTVPSLGCYSFETTQEFLWHCAGQDPSNFSLTCKPCHKIKTYADAKGISFEEAVIEKQVLQKVKQNTGTQKDELLAAGFSEEEMSNAKKRRECYRKLLGAGLA